MGRKATLLVSLLYKGLKVSIINHLLIYKTSKIVKYFPFKYLIKIERVFNIKITKSVCMTCKR